MNHLMFFVLLYNSPKIIKKCNTFPVQTTNHVFLNAKTEMKNETTYLFKSFNFNKKFQCVFGLNSPTLIYYD